MSAVHETLAALSTLLPSAQNVLCQSKTVVLFVTEPCIPTAEFKVQFVQDCALAPRIGYLRMYTCRHPVGKKLFTFCSLSIHMTCHDYTATLFNFSLTVNNEKAAFKMTRDVEATTVFHSVTVSYSLSVGLCVQKSPHVRVPHH